MSDNLGEIIRYRIKKSGLTQEKAAEMLGITRQTLNNYLLRADIPDDFVENVKKVLGIDITKDITPRLSSQKEVIALGKHKPLRLKPEEYGEAFGDWAGLPIYNSPKTALYLEGKELRMKWVPSKTERSGWIDIRVNPRLKKIIKLAENSSPSIFGLVHLGMEPRLTDMCIGRVQSTINKALKSYAARCGVKFPLAFHDARRAIAFHLKVKESDIYAIKDVLGHTSVNITQGYVGRNQKGVDDALKRVYG